VLTSIGVSHQPCELVDVIAAADGINHAVLMDTELETAISRLAGSDLVAIGAGPSFQLTERGADLLRRRRGDLFTQVSSVLGLLAGIDLRSEAWQLPPAAMKDAVNAYLRWDAPVKRSQ
jgi:hypothetical protein